MIEEDISNLERRVSDLQEENDRLKSDNDRLTCAVEFICNKLSIACPFEDHYMKREFVFDHSVVWAWGGKEQKGKNVDILRCSWCGIKRAI